VHHAVVSHDVRSRHHGVVDEHASFADGHRHVGTEKRGDFLTVCEVGAQSGTGHHVVLENLTEVGQRQQLFCRHHQGFSQGADGRIGGGKHSERTFSAQRVHEASCTHGRFQERVVFAVHDDVHHSGRLRSRRQQHRVDHVHHAVVSHDVRSRYHGVVDEHAGLADRHRHIGTEERGDFLTVHEVGAQGIGRDHVVLENLTEVGKGQQILCCDFQGFHQRSDGSVGGCEHRKRTFPAEGAAQIGSTNCCFEKFVIWAVDDHVNHRVLAPTGDHECHCRGNECEEMLHKNENGFGFGGGTPSRKKCSRD